MLVTTKYMYICGNMQYIILRYMLKEERHQYILNRINQNYRIYITALSAELGVSDDTLRRDLTELDERGLLTKVHGGAIAKSGIPIEFTDRLNTGIAANQSYPVIPCRRYPTDGRGNLQPGSRQATPDRYSSVGLYKQFPDSQHAI